MSTISKNFFWVALANAASSIIGTVVFIYLARTLHPTAMGELSYAFTAIFFLGNFIDLGLSTYGMREGAKHRGRISDYVSEIVSFRLVVAGVLAALVVAAALVFYPRGSVQILLCKATVIFLTTALATEWAFQGIERMHMVFVSFAANACIQLGLVLLFVKGPSDVVSVPFIYGLAALPIAFVFLHILKFQLRFGIADIKNMFAHLSGAFVLWSISLLAQAYNNLDLFILGLFRGAEEVGYFAIARRVVGAVAFFMTILASALLPRLSFSFASDIGEFKGATKKFLIMSAVCTLFILTPLIIFSGTLIRIFFGSAYIAANIPLKLMSAGLVCILFNLPYSTGLVASGMEREVLKQVGASTILSIISNFILIPKYGMIGASISFVLAEGLALAWIMVVYHKRIHHLV